jgi:hypothetical protein
LASSPEPLRVANGCAVRDIARKKLMRYLSISLTGALFLTVLSGAAFAQTAGGGSPGSARTPGAASTPSATTPGTVAPGLGGPALPSPSTTPTQRATTGVIENQQTLDQPQGQPSTIQPNPVTTNPSDRRTGEVVTISRQGSGGTATGRRSRVNQVEHALTAVIGPGQLSRPLRMERQLPTTP